MRRPDDPEVAAWLAKADGDLRMARMALEAPDPLFDQACFHSQQAAEKALKALLVAVGIPVPKPHDPVHLVDLLVPSLPSLDTRRSADTAHVVRN
jgi:HEPN domain-containing protein